MTENFLKEMFLVKVEYLQPPAWLQQLLVLHGHGWVISSYYWKREHVVSQNCVSTDPHTFMSLARLSRELISRPSLQACKHEITFCVSMRPGRIVSPERLPWKYWVYLGVSTSPPGEKKRADTGLGELARWLEAKWSGSNKKDCFKIKGKQIHFQNWQIKHFMQISENFFTLHQKKNVTSFTMQS